MKVYKKNYIERDEIWEIVKYNFQDYRCWVWFKKCSILNYSLFVGKTVEEVIEMFVNNFYDDKVVFEKGLSKGTIKAFVDTFNHEEFFEPAKLKVNHNNVFVSDNLLIAKQEYMECDNFELT